MEDNNVYLALPQAVIKVAKLPAYSNEEKTVYNTLVSEPLGFFLVRPVKRLKILHDFEGGSNLSIATVGFKEIKTGRRIITRTFIENEEGTTEAIQHDILANTTPSTGDIEWMINYQPVNIRKIKDSKIKEYLSLSKKEITARLNEIHIEALEIASKDNDTSTKKMVKTI